jgi:MFS transporter, DHA3 family, macrolide efflux protein
MSTAGRFEVWNIYVAVATGAAFSALHWPAYASSVSVLLSKEHYARANGMIQFAQGTALILSPLLGALLIDRIELHWLFLADALSFFAAVCGVAMIRIPAVHNGRPEQRSDSELSYGWRYIAQRPGLRGLLTFYAVTNYVYGVVYALVTPLLLSVSTGRTLGRAQAVMALGAVSGGGLMSVWHRLRNRVACILLFEFAVVCGITLAGLHPSVVTITAGGFVVTFSATVVMTCSQTIWQSKVALAAQGRVFGVRFMVASAALPLAYATAGPLADLVFHAKAGTSAASPLSQAGLRLMLLSAACINLISIAWAWSNPRIRALENELPDAELDAESDESIEAMALETQKAT